VQRDGVNGHRVGVPLGDAEEERRDLADLEFVSQIEFEAGAIIREVNRQADRVVEAKLEPGRWGQSKIPDLVRGIEKELGMAVPAEVDVIVEHGAVHFALDHFGDAADVGVAKQAEVVVCSPAEDDGQRYSVGIAWIRRIGIVRWRFWSRRRAGIGARGGMGAVAGWRRCGAGRTSLVEAPRFKCRVDSGRDAVNGVSVELT
jgi:hypothetical protein